MKNRKLQFEKLTFYLAGGSLQCNGNMTAPTADIGSARLTQLAEQLDAQEGYAEVVAALQAGHGGALGGVWGSSSALVASNLVRHSPAVLVVVCPRDGDVDDFCDELAVFWPGSPERFPAWETAPGESDSQDEAHGDRLRVLKLLNGAGTKLIVTSIQALLQPVPPRELLEQQTLRLRVGDEIDPAALLKRLAEGGFHNTSAVELPGEFSPRGGIIDVFAPDWLHPARIEFFGDTVESIRQFEVSTQRSLESLQAVEITMLGSSGQWEVGSSQLPTAQRGVDSRQSGHRAFPNRQSPFPI